MPNSLKNVYTYLEKTRKLGSKIGKLFNKIYFKILRPFEKYLMKLK